MNGFAGDVPVLLDGAWRVACGQVPHRDFYNFLGVLPFYVVLLGMKLGRPCVSAIDDGNVVLMAALSLAAAVLLYRRTTALLTFLFTIFIALLIVTPRALGFPFDYLDHAMLYDRYGEAFLFLLGIILFLPQRPGGSKTWDWAEAVFAGLLLVAALGCKVNYFIVSVGFFVAACLICRMSLGRILTCLVSAGAFLAIALALTGIPLSAMVHDYRIVSGCQSLGHTIGKIGIQSSKFVLCFPLLLLVVGEAFLGDPDRDRARRSMWTHVFVITVLIGGAIILLGTNAQAGEIPLLSLAALYCFEMIQRQPYPATETPAFITTRRFAAFVIVLVFLLPSFIASYETFRYATFAVTGGRIVSTDALRSTRLGDFRFISDGSRRAEMRDLMDFCDEGIQLLRQRVGPDNPVTVVLWSNPFHVALGWRPPLGGTLSTTISCMTPRSHPPLARLIGEAPYLLTERGSPILAEVYGSEWKDLHLPVVEDTKLFTLFSVPKGTAAQLEEAQRRHQP